MPIEARQNLYPGINAHLNSSLQQRGGGWEVFHTRHINDIQEALDQVLPPNYYAAAEKSLQVTLYGDEDTSSYVTLEEETINSVVIYQHTGTIPGMPVTRIELLSPANKPGGSDYRDYLARRVRVLESGVALVEIDYLHEQRPLLPQFPSYRDDDQGAFPYLILVSVPRPSMMEGRADLYEFGVESRLPKVSIPLAGDEAVTLDFQPIYNRAFAAARIFSILVDYAQNPVNFDRYSPADRVKISALLEGIRANDP